MRRWWPQIENTTYLQEVECVECTTVSVSPSSIYSNAVVVEFVAAQLRCASVVIDLMWEYVSSSARLDFNFYLTPANCLLGSTSALHSVVCWIV